MQVKSIQTYNNIENYKTGYKDHAATTASKSSTSSVVQNSYPYPYPSQQLCKAYFTGNQEISMIHNRLAANSGVAALSSQGVAPNKDLSNQRFYETTFKEGTVLNGDNLNNAIFEGSTMPKVKIQNSSIQSADFSEAKMPEAQLTGVNAKGAYFAETDLQNAKISGDFTGADFWKAQMTGITAEKALLTGSVIEKANMDNSKFSNVNLENARMWRTSAKNSVFSDVNAKNLDATGIDLTNTELINSDFTGAIFHKAILPSESKMKQIILNGAEYDNETRMQGNNGELIPIPQEFAAKHKMIKKA